MRIWARDHQKVLIKTKMFRKQALASILFQDSGGIRMFFIISLLLKYFFELGIHLKLFKMYSSRKRSLKRNKGRRKSFFQPGHPQLFHKKSAKVTFSDITETTDTTLTSRINTFELPDVMSLATTSTQSNQSGVINYRLRPAKDTHSCEKNLSEKSDISAAKWEYYC